MRCWRASAERRTQIADEFRAELMAQLGPERTTASDKALVETAVSAYAQVWDLSRRFLAGRAGAQAMQALQIARGQLDRAMRGLGLTHNGAENDDTGVSPARSPATWAETSPVPENVPDPAPAGGGDQC